MYGSMGVLVDHQQAGGVRIMPPPKKKWIRHYLLEEEPSPGGFLSFAAAAPPPPPPPPPRPPPAAAAASQQPPPPPAAAAGRPAHHQHVSNGGPAPPDSSVAAEESKEFQKRAAGTREVHNKLEKNRRAHLKECFELLKRQLPASQDEKKSSNLSILHSALRHIQSLRRKEREFEHEMERLAREKIAAQQRLAVLKKELSAQWDHIDFNTLLPDSAHVLDDPRNRDHVSHTTSTATERDEAMSDAEEPLTKCGVLYSSTSSLSSAATACSPPQLPPPPPPPPDLHGHGGDGPKSTPPTPVMQLPVSAHMVGTTGLATLVSPTIQLLAPSGLRMLPGDPQPLALTVHPPHLSTTNVVLSATSAVMSHPRLRAGSGNESADTRTTAAITLPTLHLTNKMVAGSVTLAAEAARLPGGAELNILPANGTMRATAGGKHHPITLTGGLTLPNGVLGHAGVTLTTKSIAHTPGSEASGTVLTPAIHGAGTIPTHLTSAGITHVVTPLGSHTSLTPLVTPVTVVSQGSQVAHILAAPQQLGGKMMTTTPLLKSVGPMPLMNTQYLSATALVKPVVVVSTPSTLPPHTNTSS
ncbi:max-binding protein MNT-like isoform X2 [Periplaneta americana]|uniref:max-binding protein MNT-like isoform X2 n=1 Tax=Periplaneta americana TaxID=6978 RepID=UPI0037E7F73E